LKAHSTLRSAYVRVARAQLANGDLYGARDSYRTSLQTTEKLLLRPDATTDTRYGLINSHQMLGDILGYPDELNLGDREGALRHYVIATEIGEELVAADE